MHYYDIHAHAYMSYIVEPTRFETTLDRMCSGLRVRVSYMTLMKVQARYRQDHKSPKP